MKSLKKAVAVCAAVVCGFAANAEPSWTSAVLTSADPIPAFENALSGRTPYASAALSGTLSLLTNGAIPVGGSSGTVSIKTDGSVSYKLCDDAEGVKLLCVRISSSWNDSGRSKIHVDSLSIKTVASGDEWVVLPNSAVTSASGAKCYQATYANADDSAIAEGVTDLKIEFGSQQNTFVGYSEIEAKMDTAGTKISLNVSSCNGFGTVTSDPASEDWKFEGGTDVKLTATGNADSPFDRWYGDVPAGHEYDNPLALTITDTVNITPAFKSPWVWANNVMTDGYWKVTTANDGAGFQIKKLETVADNAVLLDFRKPVIGTDKAIVSLAGSVFNGKSPIEMRLPDSLTVIGDCCRQMPNLKWLTLPANLTTLGHCAFYSCGKLRYVTPCLPATLKSWGGSENKQQFRSVPLSGKLTLSNRELTSIPSEFAYGSGGITELDLSQSGVTSIGENAFRECGSLVSISFPPTLQSVAHCSFYSSLGKLKTLTFLGKEPPAIADHQSFDGWGSLACTIYVPKTSAWVDYVNTTCAGARLSDTEKAKFVEKGERPPDRKIKLGGYGNQQYLVYVPVPGMMLLVR